MRAPCLEIKPARAKDAPIVASLVRESFAAQAEILALREHDYPNYVAFETAERIEQRMRAGEETALGLLRCDPVATVSYSQAEGGQTVGEIKRLCVLPAFRGEGYGVLLMEYAEARLRELGVLEADIALVAEFEKLARFYCDIGYCAGDVKRFDSLPFEVLFMRKSLVNQR